MQSVTVAAVDAAAAGAGAAAFPAAAAQSGEAASAPSSAAGLSGTFQDAAAAMMRHLPVAGPKVTAVHWPTAMRAKATMDNFPMDAMPPFAREESMGDIKSGLMNAKSAHQVAGTVTAIIADFGSGRVMGSVSQ